MITNDAAELGVKILGSTGSAAFAWSLHEVSIIAAIIASILSMTLSCLGILQIYKSKGKK